MSNRGRPLDNPTGHPLSAKESDGLVSYRPSTKGKREHLRLTVDDAEAVAAAKTPAERRRLARELALKGGIPRARSVALDAATGAPRKPQSPGSIDTGRYLATIEGQNVDIDPEDITGAIRGGLRFDYGAPAGYLAQARAKKAATPKPKKSRKRKAKPKNNSCPPRAPGLRATFRSSAEAAKVFYENNELFFDHVRDPYDGLRDVFDGIEVRSGKRHKKLGETPKGHKLLKLAPADAIRGTLQVIFGRTRSRRWEDVDWPLIERLGESLAPYFEPYDKQAPSHSSLYWQPFLGDLDPQSIANLDPETLGRVADCQNRRELQEALEGLRAAYEESHSCIPPKFRALVRTRLKEWSAWLDDPSSAPPSACAPDHQTGGVTCDYPSILGELRQLQGACEVGYDPDWAEHHAREGAPGFPDLTAPTPNPDEPPPEAAAAAADDSESDAPLRVVYGYDAGILICGDTYQHRAAIKGLRTKRFRFSRRLPDDCAWYAPRTRDRHAHRSTIDQIANELRRATGVAVDVDFTAPDPEQVTPMEEREAAFAERSEDRADRLDERSSKKKVESAAAYKAAKDISKWIPFGQPVLVGHHSEKRHRRDLEKIERGQRKSFEADVEAERLSDRAQASRSHAAHRKDPNFAQRRIAELQTELRGLNVTITGEAPPDWRGLAPSGPATGEYKTRLEVRRAEIVDQLAYWKQLVEESGVKVWSSKDFQPGDVLADRGGGFEIVVRVNKKTLSVDSPPHMWDLKKPYTNIKRAPVRGTDAWRKAINLYLNWLETREPQPRVFPKRAKMARKWLEANESSPKLQSWTLDDFETGDVVHDDVGQHGVVVDIKPRSLVIEVKNKDTGHLQRQRLSPSLVRGKLERDGQRWRDALTAYLREIPETKAHEDRRETVRGWLGLPPPAPVDPHQEKLDAFAEGLESAEASALVSASVHGTVPPTDIAETLSTLRLLHPQLRIPTDFGHQIAAILQTRPEHAAKPDSNLHVQKLAAQLREGEVEALIRAHRGKKVYGSVLRQSLSEYGLLNLDTASITTLGHRVAEALLKHRPGLTAARGSANTRPPEPANSLRSLTNKLQDDVLRKDVAAALRKLLRHHHPEVSFSIRTPNHSMANDIEFRPKGESRRWTEEEKAVLHKVFGSSITVLGNEASVLPWKPAHDRGAVLAPGYPDDFVLLLNGKKLARKKAPARSKPKARTKPKAEPKPRAAKAAATPAPQPRTPPAPPKPAAMKQISIWDTSMPKKKSTTKPTKNPGRAKKTTTRTIPARRRAPLPNPSKTFHLVTASQALEKAERMLALAKKAPRQSPSQLSAAMQAHSEAVLAHENSGYALEDGPTAPNVRESLTNIRRKAAAINKKALVIVCAERAPKKRPTPQSNPARPPKKKAQSEAAARALRALRGL